MRRQTPFKDDRAALTGKKNNVNAFHGNKLMQELLQKADTPRLRSRTQIICSEANGQNHIISSHRGS